MGTLGQYLKSAREARDIDLRDAAQQTRISANYLKALEDEDFTKLPGEVFVKGFLKNYARFLNLEEAETLKRLSELKQKAAPPVDQPPSSAVEHPEKAVDLSSNPSSRETPLEPFVWGAVICIFLLVVLFSSFPRSHSKKSGQSQEALISTISGTPQDPTLSVPEKLYIEIIAIEDTWLLVRTDTSPQKKAVLKKGESLIWSAEERFLLSYGRAGDVKLLLNGEELAVKATNETPIRDLAVTRSGILNQPVAAKQPLPVPRKSKPVAQPSAAAPSSPAPSEAPALSPRPASVPSPSTPAPAKAPSAPEAAAPEQPAAPSPQAPAQ